MRQLLFLSSLALIASVVAAGADEKKLDFNDPGLPVTLEITGDVSRDATKNHGDGNGASLKIGPGGKAIWRLRESDGAGKVEFWVYDDMTAPADPKARRAGPRWGLVQSDGRVLVIGPIYAPYLNGAETYATSDSDQKNWFDVQFSGVKRQTGWHKWTFDFDAAKGLSITQDDKSKARFDWNKTKIKGGNGIALFGDTGKDQPQTIWVDDITAQPAGAVQAVLTPPPAAPSVVPASDPAPDKKVELVPAIRGQHPRLLFTAADVNTLKKRASNESKVYFEQLLKYVPPSVPPKDTKFADDATEAQRQGFWRLPTVALHYVLTGDRKSFDNAQGFLKKFLETEHWENGEEQDSGMAAANIMAGAALAYDWLYNDLDPAFRAAFGKKLLLQARRLYYRGHLMKAPGTHYWQNDPQNNHRWHRDAGLALSILAVADAGPEDDRILAETLKELQFLHQWLPEDGTSHESSSYLQFGAPYLLLAFDASDRCLGTDFLKHPFFANLPKFRLHTLTPGFKEAFHYGDSAGFGGINNYLFKCTSVHRLPGYQAALLDYAKVQPDAFQFAWFSLVWFDPTVTGGALQNLPLQEFFPDLGMQIARDGWQEKDVAIAFKCAPYGGVKLNEFRNANNLRYINVAHDDPDANTFWLYANGALLADDDRYATKKLTSSHNTILVNGKGQKGEGGGWMQPLKGKDADMTNTARVVNRKVASDIIFTEGEAGGAYNDLSRYRRAVIWFKGSYVLLLDDIRGTKANDLTWLMQGKEVLPVAADSGHFRLKNGKAECDFFLAGDQKYEAKIGVSTAEHRGKSLGFGQLQATTKAEQWRLASLFDPWQRKLSLTFQPAGPGQAKLIVTGPNFRDEWNWQTANDRWQPARLTGARPGGFTFDTSAP